MQESNKTITIERTIKKTMRKLRNKILVLHCYTYLKEHLIILCKDSQSIGSKNVFDKTIAAQVHGSKFVIFDFLENDDFFLELCRILGIC